jgi:hypothetical protein
MRNQVVWHAGNEARILTHATLPAKNPSVPPPAPSALAWFPGELPSEPFSASRRCGPPGSLRDSIGDGEVRGARCLGDAGVVYVRTLVRLVVGIARKSPRLAFCPASIWFQHFGRPTAMENWSHA